MQLPQNHEYKSRTKKCMAGPGYYKTTDDDISKYFTTESFTSCPRLSPPC